MTDKIDKSNVEGVFELNTVQKGMLYHYLKDGYKNIYNVQLSFHVKGDLKMDVLKEALGIVQSKNEALRSVFRWERITTPVQIILKECPVEFIYDDLSGQQAEVVAIEVNRLSKMDQHSRFDLRQLPLKFRLIKMGEQSFTLNITNHHILYDGWSTGIFLKELFQCFGDINTGRQSVFEPKANYKVMQTNILKAARSKKSVEYWKHYLEEHEVNTLFSSRPPADNQQVSKQCFSTSRSEIETYAKKQKVTQASVIYTAYGLLLQQYAAATDVMFGTVVSNRQGDIEGIDKVIGNFINTIPLRFKDIQDKTLSQVVAEVNQELIDRSDHSGVALLDLKDNFDIKADDLYDSIIAIENYPLDEKAIQGSNTLDIELQSVYENTNFPLVVNVFFKEQLEVEFTYKAGLVSDLYIRSLASNFIDILESIVLSAEKPAASLSLSLQPEEQELLRLTNDTQVPYSKDKTILDLFEDQVEKTPQNVALIIEDEQLTYRELDERSSRIASFLYQEKGVRPNSLVGVMLERETELIPVIFGILKAGGAYVPINPDYPVERRNVIIEDAALKALVTREKYLDPDMSSVKGLVDLDQVLDEVKSWSINDSIPRAGANDLAYVIYTSGSTGKPKGVMIEQHSVVNRIQWMQNKYPITADDVLLQKTPIVFDVSVWELFWWSITGASLCMLKPHGEKDPKEIIRAINEHQISTIHFVPSMLNAFLLAREHDFNYQSLASLRQVFASGEALKPNLVHAFGQSIHKHCDTRLINLYGPTEATVDVSYYECSFEDDQVIIPIGKPIDNTRLYVLDQRMNELPLGVAGELHIAGTGLAKGYINNSKLTNQKFVKNPFNRNERLYKTGDLVRWLPDGNIDFLGRIDDQVKVRGFRIEPGGIEARLVQHSQVYEALVVTRSKNEDTHLVAYYLADAEIDSSTLRDHILVKLPAYMAPTYFIRLEKFPLTSNGKINRKLLPAPEFERKAAFIGASGQTEETLLNIWSEVLGHDKISTNQNFFDVGGDSLKLITVSSKVSKAFRREVSVTDLFNYPTIARLAGYMSLPQNGTKSQSGHQPESKGRKEEKQGNTSTDIAIIGMAGRFPGAQNINEFWENLRSGTDCISRDTNENGTEGLIKAKGILEGQEYFEPSFFKYTPDEADKMDPQMRVFHECSWEALEDAGYNPFQYEGDIGLYAGAAQNPYYAPKLAHDNPGGWLDDWQSYIYSTQDYLCTRVSYKLNLRGPSVNIATACSTSLVAIDAACRDLISGRCDIALSGGITLTFHDNSGYTYKKDMILSPDGYCRAFDKNAAGTVGGNGVGIVVLKKLSDALRDGDNIHAIIKGSATNNDGFDKVGFTAPSITGQAKVIQSAIDHAGIDSESISYVETHGTGTLLGDPIELEGLKRAFDSEKRQFCAIGSVKTNLGHLDAAAGVAGLIKTVLSLKHKQIPPSLHFESPNETLGIEDSPFYVNNQLQDWQRNGTPRRAGVSSFGIGGTNAHVILEEAPELDKTSEKGEYQLMVMSAKTQAALDRNMVRLKAYLETDTSQKLEDIAFTLNQGRAHFDYRKFIVSKDKADAIAQLTGKGQRKGPARQFDGQSIAFMFPGQGAQYLNMLRDLYEGQEYFRTEVDLCFELAKEVSGKDLKAIVFADSADAENSIDNTEFTQPLLFVMEYALARLLMEWGIKPDVMIGHSIGEYAAACISGVFTLKEALTLVVKRGELMQKLPTGAMLSLTMTEEELKPFLTEAPALSLAVLNSTKSCVVSGPQEAIDLFQKRMEKEGYQSKEVQCSHAFHSAMMDGMLEKFTAVVDSVDLKKPQIPFISNLTGTEAQDDQVTTARYWVKHLRETVRFADGVDSLMANKKMTFIEVGPGSILSTLAQANPNKAKGHKVVNLARHPKDQKNDRQYLLSALGKLYLNGVALDWQAFYQGHSHRKVSLPTYSFEKIKYPVKAPALVDQQAEQQSLARINDVSQWFYVPSWKMLPLFFTESATKPVATNLIFADKAGLSQSLVGLFEGNGDAVIQVNKGAVFKAKSNSAFLLNPAQEDHMKALFEHLAEQDITVNRIVFGWNVGAQEKTDANLYNLIELVQAANANTNSLNIQLVLLTNELQSVLGNENIDIAQSNLTGILKVIAQEYPGITTSHIDVQLAEVSNKQLLDALYQEIIHQQAGKTVAFRNSRRWVQVFEQLQTDLSDYSGQLRKEGVYLITGGLGDLGYNLSKYLLKNAQSRLILTGRSALGEVDQGKAEKLSELQALGEVMYIAADVVDLKAMKKVVALGEDQFGTLHGVIHAAGIIGDDPKHFIKTLNRKEIDTQLASKVAGTAVLQQVLGKRDLDFCILTSSISTILGGLGFAAYASANAYMDQYAQASAGSWLSVNFDGLNLNGEEGEGIDAEEMITVFNQLWSFLSLPQVVISIADLNKRLNQWVYKKEQTGAIEKRSTATVTQDATPSVTEVADSELSAEDALLALWQNFFGTSEIFPDDSFFAIGGDSLKALTMIDRIESQFGVALSVEQLFANPTIAELLPLVAPHAKVEIVEATVDEVNTSIPKASVKDIYALSAVQQRLYFLNEFDKDSLAYNMPSFTMLEGTLGVLKLKKVFNTLGLRHESLRTFFDVVDGTPVQRILAGVDFKIEEYEASEEDVETVLAQFIRPFDLSRAPLMRVGLIRLSAQKHLLMVDMHHLINDGVSRGILIKDFMALYNEEELAPLSLQYKDYSEWQQSKEQATAVARQKDFWLEQFTEEVDTLQLPLDFARPAIKTYVGEHVHFQFNHEITTNLKAIASEEGATMFMVLLSAFNILLSKLSLQEDIVVGTSTAGRHQRELEDVIGMFVKTIPLRNRPEADLTFSDFLKNVRSQVIRCFDNQAYPYEALIEELNITRDTSHNPLFDVLFSYENFATTDLVLPDLTLKPYAYDHKEAKFDLTLTAGEKEGQLYLNMNYNVALFTKETIERFVAYFESIVHAVVSDVTVVLKDIDILSEKERSLLISEFNDTAHDISDTDTLVSRFEAQAASTPDKVAVVYEDQRLTYKELNEQANQLACMLRETHGLRPNDVVGIMLRRSEKMMIGLLGILKSGAAYLPIDPDHPKDRVKHVLSDSQTNVLITTSGLKTDLDFEGEVICLNQEIEHAEATVNLKAVNRAQDLCYLIYTSGSTGKPKGVMISHHNVMNFFSAMSEKLPVTEEDTMLAVTNTSFDISVLELFWTLCQGIEVIVHPSGTSLNNLDRYVAEQDITMDFGLFFFSSYNNEGDDKYDLLLDAVRYADETGFNSVWTPERHFHEFGGLFPNPSVMSSALAMITDQVQLRSGSAVLPLHDEIRLVEEWSVVDNLSNGRVGLSFAAGWNPNDFVLRNTNYEERHKNLFEKIDTVRNLWKGGSVSRENGFGKSVELNAFPVPVQKELPIWVTSGGNEETFKSAGAIGANLLTHLLGQDLEELARKINIYREARKASGFDPNEGIVSLMLHTYVGEDIEEVERIVEKPFIQYLESSFALNKAIFEDEGVDRGEISEELKAQIMKNAFKRYYKSSALIGTRQSCSDMVVKLKQIGVDEIACLVDFGVEQSQMMEGLKYLKELKDLHAHVKVHQHQPVTMMQSTPSFVGHLTKDASSQAFLKSLNTLLVGGEAVPLSLVRGFKETTDAAIFNMYGPTETTIWSCVYEFTGEEDKVSIGRPIANTQVYILDKERNLVPMGVAGDLYIGGKGLSGQYWNRPELTAVVFVDSPFVAGEKIYKTGDVARWLSNGTLEFIGRTDFQIKLKGYRIELGEIEHSLREYVGINEAVVSVKGTDEDPYLIGYLVTGAPLDFTELRAQVGAKLPHYMIPSDFMVLDALPLTPNGKVNRKALPEPTRVARDEYEAPQTEKERLLVEIWSKVLDVENIGVTDNFFAVGGDSIKSIQIISRVRNAGFDLATKDIFISQTIRQLAPKMGEIVLTSDQSTLEGASSLSPIQQWYFDTAKEDTHYYNHAVMLNFPEGISAQMVQQIFDKLQAHHDALRTVFVESENEVTVEIKGLDMPLAIEEYDLKGEQDAEAVMLERANEIQASIDLAEGPLMKLGCFQLEEGSRLLIVIHHLVIDGVSWRIIFEDIASLYEQLKLKKSLSLQLKTDSFHAWSDHLHDYMETPVYAKARDYWQSLSAESFDLIPRDNAKGENTGHHSSLEPLTLDSDYTQKLITEVHEAFSTQINDILLAALFLSIRKTYGLNRVMVDVEGHGREDLGTQINVGRTVGWFTSIFKVLLEAEDQSLAEYIKHIKEIVRRVPNNGIDYLLTRYFDNEATEANESFLASQVSFNYLGQFNADAKNETFELIDAPVGDMVSAKATYVYDWDIVGKVVANELEMTLRYSADQYHRQTVQDFMAAYKTSLEEIIDCCCNYGKTDLTPSDLIYKGLSIAQLDDIQKDYPVEDIYPLSHMQEAMLFHSLMDPDSAHYFEQLAFDLKGDLDIGKMEQSINALIQRYDIFRTVFLHQAYEYPLQVVLQERQVDFIYEDLRVACQEQSTKVVVGEYKQKDIAQKFDLSRDIMMRLTLLRTSEDDYTLIWSYHHIVMDGWCVPILFNEFKEIYACLRNQEEPVLPVTKPYANYISWLQDRDEQEALSYWQHYLSGYDSLATLPATHVLPESGDRPFDLQSNRLVLDQECVDSLNEISRTYGVTINTIIQLAWSVLLSRYNNVDDVVFGAVVSGRPSEIEGIESMIGMFINTVPVRVNFAQEESVSDILKRVQEEVMSGTPYHHSPLAKVQTMHELGTGLFNHIILFDNYPFAEDGEDSAEVARNGFRVTGKSLYEQSFFDFYLVVVPRGTLHLEFNYNANAYDALTIERVKGHFVRIVEQFIADVQRPIAAIDMISEGERAEVLEVFNNTWKAFDKDKTFISLFEEQVHKTPENIAVVHYGESLSYEELYEKAGKLSALLQSKGLKDNQKVALYMPRGIDMLTSILAVFYAGGAYVPIDVTYPEERVKEILSNSESRLVLTHRAHQEQLENLMAAIPTLETTLAVDGLALEAFVVGEKVSGKPDDLAYIIYTSGTTGKPKGVMIHQRGMVNHLYAKINDLDLRAADIVAQTASPCFDISVWQFLSALVVGGKTMVIDNDIILEPKALVNALEKEGVTIFESVPSLITTFLDGLPSDDQKYLQALRWMIPTGEALSMGLVKKWYAYFPQIPLLNAYGPTEASDDVTHFVVPYPEEGQSTVPIGKPVQNTRIYIVDQHLNLCPVGVKGEICVAGLGVGKGYWKNEEKTKSAFVNNPFGGDYEGIAFDTLYKTGDVGYYRSDGNIVCLGRVDSQVKIRGFRIELEEIESHLAMHEHIEEVAVIIREKNGLKFLIAYYVAAEVLETSMLRDYLLGRLPDYMVPSYFVHLMAMPLTANGKLNRKALPEVEGVAMDDYVAPVTAGEKLLTEVWSNVLDIDQVGVSDNFFLLGGDSIKSIQICSRVRSQGFELTVQDIFAHQTISELAQQLKALQMNPASVAAVPLERNGRLTTEHLTYQGLSQGQLDQLLERYDIEDIYPLSSMQEGMLYHALIDLNAGDYFGQSTYELQGKLDLKLVEESMNELMSRYAILRTIFLHEGYSRPIQVVLKERKIDFSHHDLRHELNGLKEGTLEAYHEAEKSKPFDLTADVLMRLVVLQSADDEFELIWSHHHVLMDGWCIGILVNEFAMIYTRKLQDRPAYLQPTTPYSTYIQWLENRQEEASQTYWKDYLAGLETALTFPQKDTTTKTPYVLKKQYLQFSKEETSQMENFARQHGVTMNSIFQSAWGLMLARYNNANDVVFGSVVSGRPVEIEGVETMIGLFINTIPTRVSFRSEDTVGDLLLKTQQGSINSGPHHYFPLAEIQTQSELSGDLINHIVAFENFPITRHLIDPEADALEEAMPFEIKKSGYWVQTNYDLSLTVIPTEEFEVIFDYNQNKYQDNTIEQMQSALKHIMTAFVSGADQPLTGIALFGEQSQIAQSQSGELTVPMNFVTIQERLAISFSENRAGTAIEYKGQSYDYATLEATANSIAHAIEAADLSDESNIGIFCENRYWMISGMLGVLKARKAFVPLEATLPPSRLISMIDQTEAKLIITDQSVETCQSLKVAESIAWITTTDVEAQPKATFEIEKGYQADDRIYVYFTSGSTGNPKGVIGRNTGLSHFIGWEIDTYGIDNNFRISQFTNPGFDVFMRDVFVPLCAGGTLCIPEGNVLELDQGIHHWISEQRINLIHCVPSLFKLIQREAVTEASFEDLKYVLLAGEKILPWELKDWYNTFAERINLVNIYGPTETTLAKAAYLIKPEDTQRSFVPLKAIPGAQMLILDEDLNLCPQGAIGEIHIRTPYRSHGYLGLHELNEKSFIANPFGDHEDDILYKTGDLGRLHQDDEVEVLGRVDNQIKIRGIRIELDDIKQNICKFQGVSDAVVLVKEDEEGDKLIMAYMVEEVAFETSELRAFLEETLPPNMIPGYLITLPEFPLLPNGKINRKELPDPALEVAQPEEQAANPIEAKLLDIWAEVLKVEKDQISTTKTFFEMGGHSVKVFHIINKIQQEFSVKLKLAEVFKNASVKEIGRLIAELGHEEIEQIPTAAQRDFYAASPAQERMYYQHLLHGNSTAFNISIPLEIKGEVEMETLRSSFQILINRHEGLRTSFALTDDGVIQRIHKEVSFELEMLDQKAEDVEAAFEAFTKPFDLSAKSLIRAGLMCNTKGNFLFINLHHIVADGRSLDILIQDFKKIHLKEALEPLKLRYVDYACWLNENKEKQDIQEQYWTEKLSGELIRTDLPMISEREEVDTKLVSYKELEIGEKVYEEFKTLAANYKVSDFMLLLSAYYILLHKMSGESDLIIGTEVLGRTQVELKDVVGTFVNVLPLRVDANAERPYVDFLSDVKECVLQAFDNQDLQFEQMVKLVSEDEESPGRNPFFDFYFSLANTVDSDAELGELKLEPINFGKRVKGEYEFAINVVEHNQKMTMSFIYSHKLYDGDTIDLLMDYYHNILTDILKDQTLRIEDINMEGVLS